VIKYIIIVAASSCRRLQSTEVSERMDNAPSDTTTACSMQSPATKVLRDALPGVAGPVGVPSGGALDVRIGNDQSPSSFCRQRDLRH